MINKAKFLIKQSLKKKMKTKWFLVVNIVLCLLLIGVTNLDNIIDFFGGDFNEKNKIYVVDEMGIYSGFESIFNELGKNVENFSNYEIVNSTENISELKEKITKEDDIIVHIKLDNENILSTDIISYDPVDTITKQLLTSTLTSVKTSIALNTFGLTEEQLNLITSPVEANYEITNPELDENAEAKDILSTGSILIFLIPFFILVILIVQMIGAEINDEKTTRGMEIIISNVSPKVHFISKILATVTFAVTQCILVFIYSTIGLLVRKLSSGGISLSANNEIGSSIKSLFNTLKNTGMLDELLRGLPILILIVLLSFLLYALFAGILASMTTSIEDFQQLQSPLMILIMVGYYIGAMAAVFEGSLFIKIVSYIPFISALVAPITFLLGQTTLIDLTISLGVIIITCFVFIRYGIRIYKVGILNYSSKDLWKKVFKSLRNKE